MRITLLLFCLLFLNSAQIDWGFFGHRRINRLAVFSLPSDLIGFYKNHIEFITEHAVDPDKRRYSTKHEAVRHYIDLDHWGEYPFEEVPRKWTNTIIKYTSLYSINAKGDTLLLHDVKEIKIDEKEKQFIYGENTFDLELYKKFFLQHVLPQYYEEEWKLDCSLVATLPHLKDLSKDCQSIIAVDEFSEYGILPYHLLKMQHQLYEAFKEKDLRKILRLSADFGHYLGDASVPLHTTENYNGYLTDQVGIHAFWESRIPELFADKEFDFFVGKAEYIDKPAEYYWNLVLKSHTYVDSLLAIEKRLSLNYEEDQQFCFEERLNRTIRTQCKAYAAAYNEALDGQVEARMREAIKVISSAWYTAWVDAGQPDLSAISMSEASKAEKSAADDLENKFKSGEIKGRAHDN